MELTHGRTNLCEIHSECRREGPVECRLEDPAARLPDLSPAGSHLSAETTLVPAAWKARVVEGRSLDPGTATLMSILAVALDEACRKERLQGHVSTPMVPAAGPRGEGHQGEVRLLGLGRTICGDRAGRMTTLHLCSWSEGGMVSLTK